MIQKEFIWRFTPSRTEPELLESIFVQRHALLSSIVDKVAESARSGNKHQCLLIGARGIGKTHLISLLHHRITSQTQLAEKIRIAWFLEDETITSFVQLLKRTYQLLSDEYPAEFPPEWLANLLTKSSAQIEKALKAELVHKFSNRTLLLFIENLDFAFEGLRPDGQKKWRSFLQEHPFTCIVATTQRLFSGVKERAEPFFGFFTPIHLHPLGIGDAVDLLSQIAKQQNQSDLDDFLHTLEGRSRIRALHHLAGGNHRIYIVLSGFITRQSLDELSQPFEKMADELTPYYQERMRWLSPQQRQIIEFLCSHDSPRTPKDIAKQLLARENTVSSQLKKLLEIGYVMKSSRGRESLYELAEPLMRLASDVKDKRRKPLQLLVDFLRVWYRPDHLSRLMQTAGTDSLRTYLSAAIAKSQTHPDPRLRFIAEDIVRADQEGRLEDKAAALEELAHTRGSARDWFELATCQVMLDRNESAIASYSRTLDIDPGQAGPWAGKGYSMAALERYSEAEECYAKSLEIKSEDAFVWTFRGQGLVAQERYEEALSCFEKAISISPSLKFTWGAKGSMLSDLDRHDEAIECLNKALELGYEDPGVFFDKCMSLSMLGRPKEALECSDAFLLRFPEEAKAWKARFLVLFLDNKFEESIYCIDNVLKIGPDEALSFYLKGQALRHIGRHVEAIQLFEEAIAIDSSDLGFEVGRIMSLLAIQNWGTAFEALRKVLEKQHDATNQDVAEIIGLVQQGSADQIRINVQTLIRMYSQQHKLTFLGNGLVRSLTEVKDEVSAVTLTAWRDVWSEAGRDHAEMEIALRIFRVGIQYLITKDDRVLLDLIATERRILADALGFEGEKTKDSV